MKAKSEKRCDDMQSETILEKKSGKRTSERGLEL